MRQAPPNPKAAAALAEMREYNAQYMEAEAPQSETILFEWHRDGDRTFTIEAVRRWFKIAMPLSEAAHRRE